jgi:hypothetical protein
MAIFSSFEELEIEGEANGAIVLREEQQEAIKRAEDHFKSESQYRKFLWNAKMRFGKTICAMQLAKKMGVKTCLIVTHRPVVNKGWKEDFNKTFGSDQHYKYGTRFIDKENDNTENQGDYYELEKFSNNKGNHLVFFVSMQYLCLSQEVNTNSKNNGKITNENDKLKAAILNKEWELVVIDEAHEGTRTSLGLRVIEKLSKPKTKVLHLSGTPFNLYQDFGSNEIYTWDYIKEQRAKAHCETEIWKVNNPGKQNPYGGLPRMNIYTYDLANLLDNYRDQEQIFKFSEFFRTWSDKRHKGKIPPDKAGCFIYEDDVNNFLDLLCKKSDETGYPFSTDEYRKNFRHTLWVVPGVSEAKALSDLLRLHKIFQNFKVINVAGNTEDEETRANALDKVLNEIGDRPDNRFTITISCGRLTTGVTVAPWTAVLYLKGSDNTSASTYLQTIFRVQSPWEFTSEGKKWIKKQCFVFDFAPNRTLQMMAETAKFSVDTEDDEGNNKKQKKGKRPSTKDDREKMREFLNFCPVVALEGGKMKDYDVDSLFAQLDRVYVDRVVRNGFNDNSLYNEQELLNLDPEALNRLQEIISKTSNLTKPEKASKFELTSNPHNAAQTTIGSDGGSNTTEEEDPKKKEEKEQKKKEKEERDKRITILRGISLRIPLLIYGAELSDESAGITIDNFTNIVDEASWEEFMPKGISKEDFNSFKSAYNPTVFLESGKRIRALAREADELPTDLRIQRIAEIFSWFHNPDKETVLTPWRVVNMHMSDCIGGYCFFNEKFDGPNQKESIDYTTGETIFIDTHEPRFVSRGKVTTDIFAEHEPYSLKLNSKVLEINSKTGLYPLFVAYSLFRFRSADFVEADLIKNPESLSIEEEHVIWDDIIRDNIFVICNTPMAKAITRRTLIGFRRNEEDDKLEPNIKCEKLVEQTLANRDEMIAKIQTEKYWQFGNKKGNMKFNAIVGNPPYQKMDEGASDGATPIYNHFVSLSKEINPNYISMITPSRWFAGGKGLDNFREEMLKDKRLSKIVDFVNAKDCFPNTSISGGINYFLWDSEHNSSCEFSYYHDGVKEKMLRNLNEFSIFIRYNNAINIIHKTNLTDIGKISNLVSSRNPFGFPSNKRGEQDKFENSISLFSSDGWSYILSSEVDVKNDYFNSFKVMTSKVTSEHAGEPDKNGMFKILARTELIGPSDVCTDSYLVIGSFDNKNHAVSLLKYLKTKFSRFLLLQAVTSINLSKDKFDFIPIQDFTENSDLNWSKSILEIDSQLYTKYGLTNDEIEFIEKMIKPMD